MTGSSFWSCCVLDSGTRSFRYCNAGHPYPILVSSGAVRTLDQGGRVLGVFPAWVYQESSVDLNSGDRLLLFTDGITEAEGPEGEEFGTEKVAAFAKAHAANSAAKINQHLLAQVMEFCGAQFQDDATLPREQRVSGLAGPGSRSTRLRSNQCGMREPPGV